MWVSDKGNNEPYSGKIYAYDLATTERDVHKDFNFDRRNIPDGIWSDGTTIWVADGTYVNIYAYDLATKARDADKDFGSLLVDAGNISPTGIWSDGTTMWIADLGTAKIYAYDLATKARDAGKDFDTLIDARNIYPTGIWSDGTTMWVANYDGENEYNVKIYAYNLATKRPIP